MILTDIDKNISGHLFQQFVGQTELKHLGEPEEVDSVIVFIASNATIYITSAVIDVSGGMRR